MLKTWDYTLRHKITKHRRKLYIIADLALNAFTDQCSCQHLYSFVRSITVRAHLNVVIYKIFQQKPQSTHSYCLRANVRQLYFYIIALSMI